MQDDRFINCRAELKRLRQLQYDCEWEDKTTEASHYKARADHYQNLIDNDVELEPLF